MVQSRLQDLFGFCYRRDYAPVNQLTELSSFDFKLKGRKGEVLSKANPQLWNKGIELVSALHLVLRKTLPSHAQSQEDDATKFCLPQLGNSNTSTCFCSYDFSSETHLNPNDYGGHLVVGGWFVGTHHCSCLPTCPGQQFFVLSSYRMAIQLDHNMVLLVILFFISILTPPLGDHLGLNRRATWNVSESHRSIMHWPSSCCGDTNQDNVLEPIDQTHTHLIWKRERIEWRLLAPLVASSTSEVLSCVLSCRFRTSMFFLMIVSIRFYKSESQITRIYVELIYIRRWFEKIRPKAQTHLFESVTN